MPNCKCGFVYSVDKHSLCVKCRGQVCNLLVFCDECKDWSTEFREIYVRHLRTLKQKRSSKDRLKAKAHSFDMGVIDDDEVCISASETCDSVPVDPLQAFSDVDVVEATASPPVPTSQSVNRPQALSDSDTINKVFSKLNSLLDAFRGSRSSDVKKKTVFFRFFPNFSRIFIISCIICISELPAKE